MATPALGSSMAAQAQMELAQSREQSALRQVSANKGSDQDAKIEKGAKEFEAILLGSWLQQAEQSMATVPGADQDEDSLGGQQMMSLGVQSLSTSLASTGGIGIARMLVKAMHAEVEKGNSGGSAAPLSGEILKNHESH